MAEQGKNNTLLIVLALLACAGLLYFALSNSGNDWRETYYPDSKEPYNTWLLRELLQEDYQDKFIVIDSAFSKGLSLDTLHPNATYLFIGDRAYYDSLETNFLLDFVAAGRTAFIATNSLPGRLSDTLFLKVEGNEWTYDENLDYYEYEVLPELNYFSDSSVTISNAHSINKDIKLTFVYDDRKDLNYWGYFRDSIYSKNGLLLDSRGFLNDTLTNSLLVPFGKGKFIFHCTPITFTNYQMRKKEVFDYVDDCLNFIPKDASLLWDEASLQYKSDGMSESDMKNTPPVQKGPLSFILSQRSLKWAWYCLLCMGFLYILLGARRKQAAIPILEKRQNTSIEFAETLSQLYGSKNDHRQIAQLKWKLFLSYLRRTYGLQTTLPDEKSKAELIAKISLKSGLPGDEIKEIFQSYQRILVAADVSGELLSDFHTKTSYFYKNSK